MRPSFLVRALSLALASLTPVASATHVRLRYLNNGEPLALGLLAADSAGNLFAVGTVRTVSSDLVLRVIKTDPNGVPLASYDFGSLNNIGVPQAHAAAVDPQGNLIIVGEVGSAGFPLVNPLFPSVSIEPYSAALVVKLDSQLHSVLFSTLLPSPSRANAVTLDSSGNIYVAGDATASDFPLSPGAYHTKYPGAFVTAISSKGDRILYSTYLNGENTLCSENGSVSQCSGPNVPTSARTIALDASGAIVIGGTTQALDLPVIPGALGTTCVCGPDSPAGFVAKFSSGARQLLWATYVNPQALGASKGVFLDTLALDSAGNVIVGGQASSFPTTPGTVQPVFPGYIDLAGFVAKLSNTGTSLIWSSYFGGVSPQSPEPAGIQSGGAAVTGLAVDSQDRIVLTGQSNRNLLPAPADTPLLGDGYVARLSTDGKTIDTLYVGPEDAAGVCLFLNAAGLFTVGGPSGSLWIETAGDGPSLLAVANAASVPISGLAAPYELLSLHGIGIGPQTPADGQVQNGSFTTTLSGTRVLFDGTAAPLLYAGPDQINTIVPREITGQVLTHLEIVTPAATVAGPTMSVQQAAPYIFADYQTGFSSALNQDGSVNSPGNPAKPGSVVTTFATGCGPRIFTDGQIVSSDSALPLLLPTSVLGGFGKTSLEVLYAGDAPTLVAGVCQINFRLPASLAPFKTYSFQLEVGEFLGGSGFVAVAP
jgi:uncharacterized protein (TIGR03437 family)